MKTQDFIAESTNRAMEAFIEQVKKVPEDKRDWQPDGEGRSALDQLQECAVIPGYMGHILATREAPKFDEETMTAYMAAKNCLDTVEKAEALLRENTAKAVEAIKAVPDADLDQEMSFFGPRVWKVAEVMNSHAWNLNYHTGQVCYIQTLLGDKSM